MSTKKSPIGRGPKSWPWLFTLFALLSVLLTPVSGQNCGGGYKTCYDCSYQGCWSGGYSSASYVGTLSSLTCRRTLNTCATDGGCEEIRFEINSICDGTSYSYNLYVCCIV